MSGKIRRRRGRKDFSISAPHKEPERLRRRGGQPGNINALRHGVYAHDLDLLPLKKFREAEMRRLFSQAAGLKEYMSKIYTANFDSTDPATLLSTLRALSLAGLSLSNLLQRYFRLRMAGDSPDSLDDLFSSLDTAADRSQDPDN